MENEKSFMGNITPTRPCKVDGAPAYFHRFVDDERGVIQVGGFVREEQVDHLLADYETRHVLPNHCKLEKLKETRALIEWPDGRLCTVALERVQFTDREG